MNIVQISGRLTRAPEIRYFGERRFPILELNVACEDADGRWNSETKKTEVGSGFYKAEVKGAYAEALMMVLDKGDEVYVVGSLTQFRTQPKGEGEGQTKTSIAAKFVQPLKGSGTGGTIQPPSNPAFDQEEEPF